MLSSTNPSAILGQGTLTQKIVFRASNIQLSPLIRNVEGMYMAGASSSLLADLLLVPSHIRPKLKTESKESLDQAAGTKNYRQFWAEQFLARRSTAAGKIELGGADPLILSSTTKLKKPERQ